MEKGPVANETKNKQEICSRAGRGCCLGLLREQNQEGRNMKRTAQIAVIGALLAVGIAQSYAQTPSVVSQLTISLSGFAGGESAAAPVKITNKDIINALNAAGSDFGNNAKLMIVVPADGGSPSFIVRQPGVDDTDVSDFFSTDLTEVVRTSNGKTQYEIRFLAFSNGEGESFDVNGFATDKIGKVNGKDTGPLEDQVVSSNSTVSGTGTVDGTSTVLKGTIKISGAKGENH
jgi:hypothetical protein